MIRISVLLILCFTAQFSGAATLGPQVTNRNLLCSLKYGVYENNAYVGSTPMEDACRTEHYESRKRICEHNYKQHEIVEACISTYDAATEQIRFPNDVDSKKTRK
jgi:hypothetical protein